MGQTEVGSRSHHKRTAVPESVGLGPSPPPLKGPGVVVLDLQTNHTKRKNAPE